mmetsp:Transcript_19758/g.17487  ORF Transcript_19758/g.17487 Transcript_19758/m.17487 type:complete len:83 (+) Transcript_19758:405-653(+)
MIPATVATTDSLPLSFGSLAISEPITVAKRLDGPPMKNPAAITNTVTTGNCNVEMRKRNIGMVAIIRNMITVGVLRENRSEI